MTVEYICFPVVPYIHISARDWKRLFLDGLSPMRKTSGACVCRTFTRPDNLGIRFTAAGKRFTAKTKEAKIKSGECKTCFACASEARVKFERSVAIRGR